MRALHIAIVTAGLLVLATAARAQEPRSKLEPPDLERFRRWGPIWARPGIELSNVGYDTNILVSPPGQEVPDYTATVSPRIEGLLLFGHSGFLGFREQFDYTGYLENPDQNYPANRFETRFTLPAERAGLYVEGALNNFQERPTDLQDIRARRRDQKLGTGLILEPGWRTQLEIGAEVQDIAYHDPDDVSTGGRTIDQVLDRTETAIVLDGAWTAAGRTQLLLEAGLQTVDFNSPGRAAGLEIDRDGGAWRLLPGIRLADGGPLVGEAHIGWGTYEPHEPNLPRFSDWIGDMHLTQVLGTRTRLILSGSRTPGFSLVEGSPYYLSAEVGMRAIHYLTRLVGLELGGSVGKLTFPGSFAVEERIDDLRNWDGGVRLRMFQGQAGGRLEYSIRLTHYDRESTVPTADRSGTTLSMGAVAGF